MDRDAILFIYGSGAPNDFQQAILEINSFRKQHETGGVSIVSFHDRFPESMEEEVRCVKWREVCSYEEMLPVWKAAYGKLNEILPELPISARELVEIYYHDVAFSLWQIMALPVIVAKQQGPTCCLVPSFWLELDQLLNLRAPAARYRRNAWQVSLYAGYVARVISHFVKTTARKLSRTRLIVVVKQMAARHRSGKGRGFARLLVEDPAELRRQVINIIKYLFHLDLFRIESTRRKSAISIGCSRNVVVMTVEDGGSWVNLRPALRIAQEFQARHEGLVVISSSELVFQEMSKAGHSTIQVCSWEGINIFTLWLEYLRLRAKAALVMRVKSDLAMAVVSCWVCLNGLSLIARKRATFNALDKVNGLVTISSLLTIYEVLPLSVTAGRWARPRNIPWVGFFPILVGDRPDAYHFPASEHLVYGDQLKNLIVSLDGHQIKSVFVTGSPTYDRFVGRDAIADRHYCQTKFPGSRSRKLVVVATEAFPDPLTEIGPVLDALGAIEGTFVVLKVHPSDSVEFFDDYVSTLPGRDLIQVIGSCDLGALLHTAELLICIISNVIVSAAVLGTPTLVCDFSNKRRPIDFVELRLCYGCFSPDKVRDHIEGLLFDSELKREMREMLEQGIRLFNGPNDGKSATRIVDHMLGHLNRAEENPCQS